MRGNASRLLNGLFEPRHRQLVLWHRDARLARRALDGKGHLLLHFIENRLVEVMKIFAPILADPMNGTYERSMVLARELMNDTYERRIFFPGHKLTFPLLYRACARSNDVSSSSRHCCGDVIPLYTEKKRSITADDG